MNNEIVLEGLEENNISSLLLKYNQVSNIRKDLEKKEEELRKKIKIFLKEQGWNKYRDDGTKTNITLITEKREIVDKKQLKYMLTDAQYAQVIRINTYEKMLIVNDETRKRLKKYAKKAKF